MRSVLDHCLRANPGTVEVTNVAQWWPRHQACDARWRTPIDRSIAGGFDADRLAWAFAAGYQGALRQMVPDLADDTIAAFCVTEETGNRPRDIVTLIDGDDARGVTINGAKRWSTLGPASTTLLVAGVSTAHAGSSRPVIRIARVPSQSPGVGIALMADTPFVPEMPHARIRLDNVKLAPGSLLPGDGYDTYVKPFRTIEDTHVTAAALACVLRDARAHRWAHAFVERIAATLAAFIDISTRPADQPVTHVLLSGALHWAHQLLSEASAHWASTPDDPAAQRWKRDAPLFDVAGGPRAQRAIKAWERLASAS